MSMVRDRNRTLILLNNRTTPVARLSKGWTRNPPVSRNSTVFHADSHSKIKDS